jgi:3-ketosteroid 9alpha-monooxygenase subunit A
LSISSGWTQLAFGADLGDDVAVLELAGRSLIAVRSGGDVGVYDATCPHRGAHLGYGGKVDGNAIICPFHGHRVKLGGESSGRFRVDRHRSTLRAGGLFVLLDPSFDTGLEDFLTNLQESHRIVSGFSLPVKVPAEYVIENVFDADHFAPVHGLDRRPRLSARPAEGGVLCVEGDLDMVRPNRWQAGEPEGDPARARFRALVFSPNLVATELGPPDEPNVVITAATPAGDGACVVRVTVAVPARRASGSPTVREVASLVSGSRTAFEQDVLIWEHLDTTVVPRYTEGDELVRAYRSYCRRFGSTR